jgi:beta-phosphoglucomutase family hydrolase
VNPGKFEPAPGGGALPSRAGPTGAGAVAPYDAVVFDMDGVVTDTAKLHAHAWKELFDEVLASHPGVDGLPPAPFDAVADYRRYVDGRSREDGVAAFLAARGVELPRGHPGDPEDAETVAGLAARKNRLFLRALDRHGVRVFPGSVALLQRLRTSGVPVGLVTASANAAAILAAAGVAELFDVVVDGTEAVELRVPGKPDPAVFLEAARRLSCHPDRVAVVEDSPAGVQAARAGGFGWVVGVDRGSARAV